MTKLTSIGQRLERMACLAEASQSAPGVATLAAQQFRGIETGARLAGINGFAPARGPETMPPGSVFSVSIIFQGAGKSETINVIETGCNDAQREIGGFNDAGVADADAIADELPTPSIRHDIQEIDDCSE
jgi:hypothetical protein